MRAALDDATIAHDQDAIGVSDRAQAMRDHKARTALHKLIERGLDLELGARIDGARSLIEQQNRRIGKHDASDAQQLSLTLRQRAAILGKHRVVAMGQSAHERVGMGTTAARSTSSRVALGQP